jgi:hypothetical protein
MTYSPRLRQVRGEGRVIYAARVLARLVLLLAVFTCACHRFGNCDPQDVNGFKADCSGPQGWMWNGSACIFAHACNCTGSDCQGLYQEREHCETAHTHCTK